MKHKVVLSSGCPDSVTRNLTVFPKPEAKFSYTDNRCFGIPLTFTDQSTTPTGSISSREWDFGNGQQSVLAGPVVNYGATGNYAVRLVVENSHACRDTVTEQLRILSNPVAQFTAHNACSNDTVHVSNNSAGVDAPLIKHSWDMGDGSSSGQFEPGRKYPAAGTYSIRLIVADSNGCLDTAFHNVDVYPSAVAQFAFSPLKVDYLHPEVTFINNSLNSSQWYWDYGDGSGSSSFDEKYTYEDTGRFTVTLTADNDFGCRDTATRTVYVEPVWRVLIVNSFTPNGDLLNDTFGPDGLPMGAGNCSFSIYNRWGQLIFKSHDLSHRWDGSYNGEQVEPGMYTYTFEMDDYKGVSHYYTGSVTLLR